jgi:hypothetical protein
MDAQHELRLKLARFTNNLEEAGKWEEQRRTLADAGISTFRLAPLIDAKNLPAAKNNNRKRTKRAGFTVTRTLVTNSNASRTARAFWLRLLRWFWSNVRGQHSDLPVIALTNH